MQKTLRSLVVILLLVVVGAITAACGYMVPVEDAKRYIRGEYPGYTILYTPIHIDGQSFNNDVFVLCSPDRNIAIAQIAVDSWRSISGVSAKDLDGTLCDTAAKEPKAVADQLARIKAIVDDTNEAATPDLRYLNIKRELEKKQQ